MPLQRRTTRAPTAAWVLTLLGVLVVLPAGSAGANALEDILEADPLVIHLPYDPERPRGWMGCAPSATLSAWHDGVELTVAPPVCFSNG